MKETKCIFLKVTLMENITKTRSSNKTPQQTQQQVNMLSENIQNIVKYLNLAQSFHHIRFIKLSVKSLFIVPLASSVVCVNRRVCGVRGCGGMYKWLVSME